MATRHEAHHKRIYCTLTNQDVTIQTVVAKLHLLKGIDSRDAGESCLDQHRTCPYDCIHVSGGKGFGTDPETGQQVSTSL